MSEAHTPPIPASTTASMLYLVGPSPEAEGRLAVVGGAVVLVVVEAAHDAAGGGGVVLQVGGGDGRHHLARHGRLLVVVEICSSRVAWAHVQRPQAPRHVGQTPAGHRLHGRQGRHGRQGSRGRQGRHRREDVELWVLRRQQQHDKQG